MAQAKFMQVYAHEVSPGDILQRPVWGDAVVRSAKREGNNILIWWDNVTDGPTHCCVPINHVFDLAPRD
jgi:hypothetical protein